MISEIKNISSSDIMELESYRPENEESFSFSLRIVVGTKGSDEADMFDIEICTPKWLLENCNEDDIILGKNKIIVFKYDLIKILEKVKKIFNNCFGNSWDEIAYELSKFSHWEFDNYRK